MSPKSDGAEVLRAVATDGHRLARVDMPAPDGAKGMPGVIIPRKAVNEVRKLIDEVRRPGRRSSCPTPRSASPSADAVLTSKLIDGTFPDYTRVIPETNDKLLEVDAKQLAEAVDRVSTISTEKSRAVKMGLDKDKMTLSVTSPDSGSATEELAVTYDAEPMEIGFNARYILDIVEPDRKRHDPAPAVGRDRADHRARRRGQRHALRADADAGMTGRRAEAQSSCHDRSGVDPSRTAAPARAARSASACVPAQLTDFRNYAAADIEVDARPVVLTGPNGAGKTNLLEAMSYLGAGPGLARRDPRRGDAAPTASRRPAPGRSPPPCETRDGDLKLGTGLAAVPIYRTLAANDTATAGWCGSTARLRRARRRWPRRSGSTWLMPRDGPAVSPRRRRGAGAFWTG